MKCWYAIWKICYITLKQIIMKTVKLLAMATILLSLASCDAFKQATNTTGGAVFSLNGKWQLNSNVPENTLLTSIVTVTPFISQGTLTTVANNTQCYREKDVKWKTIKTDKAGGYTIENSTSSCTTGTLSYLPATVIVVNNNEIKIVGKNAAGIDNTETWTRVK
jgi:hypothetical protein